MAGSGQVLGNVRWEEPTNMWSTRDVYEKLTDGWERSETTSGAPYYINHNNEKTQWDHPFMAKVIEELGEMDNIRYAAYRTAMKLRFLQKRLNFDLVDLGTVTNVFKQHGYQPQKDTVLDCVELERILVDVFYSAKHQLLGETGKLNADQSAEMALNWLLNLYDVKRSGYIRLVSVKVALATICAARLAEKYRFYFWHLQDFSNQVSRKRLGAFLYDLVQIPELLNESTAFGGTDVGPAVDSCFKMAMGHGVTEEVFINWLLKEPQTLLWLPTMHRMAASEAVKHEAKCNICRMYPIVGFRYRCLKCFNYDLCQRCFYSGRTSKSHKLKHPTEEYCYTTSTKDDTKAFMKTVRNNLSKKYKKKHKPGYLPIQGDPQSDKENYIEDLPATDMHKMLSKAAIKLADMETVIPSNKSSKMLQTDDSLSREPSFKSTPPKLATPDQRRELSSIIHHLEDENKALLAEIQQSHQQVDSDVDSTDSDGWNMQKEKLEVKQEILESYSQQLELQLRRLRLMVKKDELSPRPLSLKELSHMPPPESSHSTLQGYQQQPSQEPPVSSSALRGQQLPLGVHPPPCSIHHTSDQQALHTSRSPQRYQPITEQETGSQDPDYRLPPPINRQFLLAMADHATPYDRFTAADEDDLEGYDVPDINIYSPQTPAYHSYANPNSLGAADDDEEEEDDEEEDLSYDPLDSRLGQTHFTLPSPDKSHDFSAEEAELRELLNKLDEAYPSNMSYSRLSQSGYDGEMFSAANRIGDAMSEFVGKLGSPGKREEDGYRQFSDE